MTLDHLTPKIHVADTVSLTRKAELGTTTHAWDWRLYVGRVQGSKLNSNSILTSSCLPKKCLGRHCSSPDAYHICKHACSKMLAYNTIPTRTAAQPSGGTSVLTVTGIYTMAEGLSTLRCSPRCPRFRRLCQNCRSCTSQFCREGPAYGGVAVASRLLHRCAKGSKLHRPVFPSKWRYWNTACGAHAILEPRTSSTAIPTGYGASQGHIPCRAIPNPKHPCIGDWYSIKDWHPPLHLQHRSSCWHVIREQVHK